MDSSTVVTVVTAFAALIGAASPIIVSLIQYNKDKKDKSEKPKGFYVPDSYVFHHPKPQIRWFVVLSFAFLGGLVGYGGAKFASNIPSNEAPTPTVTIAVVTETPEPTFTNLVPTETFTPTPTASQTPFTGTWQGIDPSDGSVITISLTQTGKELNGIYNDSFSRDVDPPGWHGSGSGTILSPTTAHIPFELSRWDGQTGRWYIHFIISNENNTITLDSCGWDYEKPTNECAMIMQRQ